jgi:hypothetical protein
MIHIITHNGPVSMDNKSHMNHVHNDELSIKTRPTTLEEILQTQSLYAFIQYKIPHQDKIRLAVQHSFWSFLEYYKWRNDEWDWIYANAMQYQKENIKEWVLNNHAVLDYNNVLEETCHHGNIDTIKTILKSKLTPTRWNNCIESACQGGHIDVVKFCVQNANRLKVGINWLGALWYAVLGDNLSIVEYVLSEYPYFISGIIDLAIDKKRKHILVYFLQTYPSHCADHLLLEACSRGLEEYVLLALQYGAKITDKAIDTPGDNNHLHIIKLLVQHGADTNRALMCAVKCNNLELVKWLIDECGAKNVDAAFDDACCYGYLDLIHLFIEKYKCKDWNEGLYWA